MRGAGPRLRAAPLLAADLRGQPLDPDGLRDTSQSGATAIGLTRTRLAAADMRRSLV